MLSENDIAMISHLAQRFSGALTGTSGTLAGDVLHLLAERQVLLVQIARLQDRAGYDAIGKRVE